MKVIPLGTNGFFESFDRATACFAIPLKKTLIILDAGSGLFRLAEPTGKKLLQGIKEVHLFLSHYHLDHTFGFYAAWRLLREKKVTVFASSSRKVFSDLAKDYFPIDFDREFQNFSWKVIREGNHKIDNYQVAVRIQEHLGAKSLAFRFDFGLAYVTDSEPTKGGIDFVRGVKLLLHEHYLSGEEALRKRNIKLSDYFLGKHVTTVGAALIAKEAKVGKLVLIHHFPFYDEKRLQKLLRVARSISPITILAQDLKVIEF